MRALATAAVAIFAAACVRALTAPSTLGERLIFKFRCLMRDVERRIEISELRIDIDW